ncbi:hypothetical protein SBY92_005065 [Candida maltosa Xu316]
MSQTPIDKPIPSTNNNNVFANKLQSSINRNRSQDFWFKLFTYTIILLPTLTSILFPTKSTTISTSEHIGNFIIDLLTVLLLSLVVEYTMEWPHSWLRRLQKTRISLLRNMTDDNFEETILLVRKIYTFEVIALISCLVSSVFSSALLIWTRQYTIIDQKRKKVVFSNINIALLQFWSVFRILITFTDSLQESSFGVTSKYWDTTTPSSKNWYNDLKHYFIPNFGNQILLDHLQQNNRQFKQLKLDLINLQQEIAEQNLQKKSTNKPKDSSFTPFPLNMSAPNSPTSSVNLSPINLNSFGIKQNNNNIFSTPTHSRSNSLGKSSLSLKKSSLNTIIEEDDSTLYDSRDNSFDDVLELELPSILDEVGIVVKSVTSEVSLFDLLTNPNNVFAVLITELTPLLNLHFELGEYQIFRLFFKEVFDKYLLESFVRITDQVREIWRNPLYYIRRLVIYFAIKVPFHIAILQIKLSILVPLFIFRWTVLKPLLYSTYILWVILKFIFLPSIPKKTSKSKLAPPPPPPSSIRSSCFNSPFQQQQPIKPSSKIHSKFAIKPFHLSPTINDSVSFDSFNSATTTAVTTPRKRKLVSLIDVSPHVTSKSINGGSRNKKGYKYQDNISLYDD